ncbi:MAG: hypothetical protein GF350_10555 [Chitinivibrionales bacterium]|nr:hypothetical protein [Chitinivibrionales bacterium]
MNFRIYAMDFPNVPSFLSFLYKMRILILFHTIAQSTQIKISRQLRRVNLFSYFIKDVKFRRLIMARKRPPAVAGSINFIINGILTKKWGGDEFLPPIAVLAKDAGVSVVTMWKAVNVLKNEGVLLGVHGQRYRISHQAAEYCPHIEDTILTIDTQPSSKGFLWERIAQRVERDVLNGYYPVNQPFPSFKELQHRYNCTFTTCKKACEYLCVRGVIVPCNKTYMVPQVSARQSGSRIVLIIFSNIREEYKLEILNEDLLRGLEAECSRAYVKLDISGYFMQNDRLSWIDLYGKSGGPQDSPDTLGYLFVVVSPEIDPQIIIRYLTHFEKPVAVLDLVGGWEMAQFLRKRDFRFFSAAVSSRPGEEVARYLLNLGHRQIAYISPFHLSAWSHNRYSGLMKTFTTADPENKVLSLVFDNPPVIHNFYRDQIGHACDLHGLQKSYEQWKEKNPLYMARALDPYFYFVIPERVMTRAELGSRLESLFDKAAEYKEITAWVCANDDVALAAHDYLGRKKTAVPETLSLVGFDDSYESLRCGITSYNFNIRAIVRLMVRYLLNRQELPHANSGKPVEVDGMIIERQSTGARTKSGT